MKNERLISLDVFRGITIAGMILVNNPGTWSAIYPPLKHAAWNGCTPTDLIFPFFLFIVGVAITFSLSKRKIRGDNQQLLLLNILRRSAILFILGLILHGFPYFDLSEIRIPGVLQRIAVVYLITSFIFLKTSFKTQITISIILLIGYWLLMSLVPVPGIGSANLDKTTNLAAWLDNFLLNGHLWSYSKVWDPEGILSTMPALSTTLIGIIAGNWLKSENSNEVKTVWILISGNLLMLLGYIWDGWFPINKSLWTSSYVLYTGGLALIFLGFCYWLIDVKKIIWWIKPFQVYGMNAITVFFLSSLTAKLMSIIKVTNLNGETVSIKTYLFSNIFSPLFSPITASLIWAVLYVCIWLGFMWILYTKKIFIKV